MSLPNRGHPSTIGFILRLHWDEAADSWRVELKAADGTTSRLFTGLDPFFRYLTTQTERAAPGGGEP